MPPKKKSQVRIRQFKNSDNDWWCGYHHYSIVNGELEHCAGGEETEELRDKIKKYLKRKKISFEH